ncbi:MAG: thrombospondin type 3 repeat-containing protein [Myxococcales bacterium]|nr:thrombospondin type 3 repeat-containing protein [Myxococcota bacterium]MDW8280392.1 thrombospondin type 3 repeat-containing protein [Myxococcales bacterium]
MRAHQLAVLSMFVLGPAGAQAHELELGGLLGGRFFSDSNELGRLDHDPRSPANAPQHTALAGPSLAYLPHRRVAVEAEGALLPTSTRDGQTTALLLAWRVQARVNLLTGRLRPFVLLGGGATSSIHSTDTRRLGLDTDGLLHGGAGLQLLVGRHLALRLEGRALFPPRIDDHLFTPEFEVLLGAHHRLSLPQQPGRARDPDGDGLPGAADRCPNQAEDRDGFQDEDGCPEADNDGDGVPDKDDRCRNQVGPADHGGCPDTDRDGDGVVDRLDRCPEQPGPNGGCPVPVLDSDGDGVSDASDACPAVAGQVGGCPDEDGDGVPEPVDRCPDRAEVRNGLQDDDGCPDRIPPSLARLLTPRPLAFRRGRPVLLRPALRFLHAAARVLQAHPGVRVEIAVYSEAAEEAARRLAQQRAEVLRRHLVDQGIQEERLRTAVRDPQPWRRGPRVELRLLTD